MLDRIGVQRQQFLDQCKRHAGLEHLLFAIELVALIGLQALLFEDPVAVFQIKQRARGNGHDEGAGGRADHRFSTHGAILRAALSIVENGNKPISCRCCPGYRNCSLRIRSSSE